jgi:ribosomal protein S18 acetylase RimI-like enzyme
MAEKATLGRPVADHVHIRAAGHEDIDAVLGVWSRHRSAAADVVDTRADLELLLDTDPQALLVAEAGGTVVGTLVATWDGWRGGIHRLVVEPDLRRAGIGRALVDEAHRRLEARGAKRINILVADTDPGATDLWLAAGYRTDPRVARYFRDT